MSLTHTRSSSQDPDARKLRVIASCVADIQRRPSPFLHSSAERTRERRNAESAQCVPPLLLHYPHRNDYAVEGVVEEEQLEVVVEEDEAWESGHDDAYAPPAPQRPAPSAAPTMHRCDASRYSEGGHQRSRRQERPLPPPTSVPHRSSSSSVACGSRGGGTRAHTDHVPWYNTSGDVNRTTPRGPKARTPPPQAPDELYRPPAHVLSAGSRRHHHHSPPFSAPAPHGLHTEKPIAAEVRCPLQPIDTNENVRRTLLRSLTAEVHERAKAPPQSPPAARLTAGGPCGGPHRARRSPQPIPAPPSPAQRGPEEGDRPSQALAIRSRAPHLSASPPHRPPRYGLTARCEGARPPRDSVDSRNHSRSHSAQLKQRLALASLSLSSSSLRPCEEDVPLEAEEETVLTRSTSTAHVTSARTSGSSASEEEMAAARAFLAAISALREVSGLPKPTCPADLLEPHTLLEMTQQVQATLQHRTSGASSSSPLSQGRATLLGTRQSAGALRCVGDNNAERDAGQPPPLQREDECAERVAPPAAPHYTTGRAERTECPVPPFSPGDARQSENGNEHRDRCVPQTLNVENVQPATLEQPTEEHRRCSSYSSSFRLSHRPSSPRSSSPAAGGSRPSGEVASRVASRDDLVRSSITASTAGASSPTRYATPPRVLCAPARAALQRFRSAAAAAAAPPPQTHHSPLPSSHGHITSLSSSPRGSRGDPTTQGAAMELSPLPSHWATSEHHRRGGVVVAAAVVEETFVSTPPTARNADHRHGQRVSPSPSMDRVYTSANTTAITTMTTVSGASPRSSGGGVVARDSAVMAGGVAGSPPPAHCGSPPQQSRGPEAVWGQWRWTEWLKPRQSSNTSESVSPSAPLDTAVGNEASLSPDATNDECQRQHSESVLRLDRSAPRDDTQTAARETDRLCSLPDQIERSSPSSTTRTVSVSLPRPEDATSHCEKGPFHMGFVGDGGLVSSDVSRSRSRTSGRRERPAFLPSPSLDDDSEGEREASAEETTTTVDPAASPLPKPPPDALPPPPPPPSTREGDVRGPSLALSAPSIHCSSSPPPVGACAMETVVAPRQDSAADCHERVRGDISKNSGNGDVTLSTSPVPRDHSYLARSVSSSCAVNDVSRDVFLSPLSPGERAAASSSRQGSAARCVEDPATSSSLVDGRRRGGENGRPAHVFTVPRSASTPATCEDGQTRAPSSLSDHHLHVSHYREDSGEVPELGKPEQDRSAMGDATLCSAADSPHFTSPASSPPQRERPTTHEVQRDRHSSSCPAEAAAYQYESDALATEQTWVEESAETRVAPSPPSPFSPAAQAVEEDSGHPSSSPSAAAGADSDDPPSSSSRTEDCTPLDSFWNDATMTTADGMDDEAMLPSVSSSSRSPYRAHEGEKGRRGLRPTLHSNAPRAPRGIAGNGAGLLHETADARVPHVHAAQLTMPSTAPYAVSLSGRTSSYPPGATPFQQCYAMAPPPRLSSEALQGHNDTQSGAARVRDGEAHAPPPSQLNASEEERSECEVQDSTEDRGTAEEVPSVPLEAEKPRPTLRPPAPLTKPPMVPVKAPPNPVSMRRSSSTTVATADGVDVVREARDEEEEEEDEEVREDDSSSRALAGVGLGPFWALTRQVSTAPVLSALVGAVEQADEFDNDADAQEWTDEEDYEEDGAVHYDGYGNCSPLDFNDDGIGYV